MIKFDINKLTFKYFNILKISNLGVVTYLDENKEEKKLKCNKSFYILMRKKIGITTFKTGKRAAILFYEGLPVGMDLPVFKVFDPIERKELHDNWVSGYEYSIPTLKRSIEDYHKDDEVYIDGRFIFFLKLDQEQKTQHKYTNIESIGEDNTFSLVTARGFPINKLIDNEFTYSVRKVIVYKVKSPENESIYAISPTLSNIKYRNAKTKKVDFDKMEAHFYVNLNFILDAAKIIGEHYGYEATEFLNLEDVLINMDTVNLYSLPDYIRKLTPIDQTFKECLSWLLGFTYRETELSKIVEYRSLFSGLMESFLLKKSYIENVAENIETSSSMAKIITMEELMSNYSPEKANEENNKINKKISNILI